MSTTTFDSRARAARSGDAATAATDGPLTLEQLTRMSVDELGRVYRDARAPADLHALAGSPAGRMLAAVGPLDLGPIRSRVAKLARAKWFPWAGKTFRALDEERGDGVNRVRLLGERYRFELSFGPSAIDGEPCVILDYDLSENPWPIRQIRDELREVSPGLFLGPALATTGAEPKLVLWFAVHHG